MDVDEYRKRYAAEIEKRVQGPAEASATLDEEGHSESSISEEIELLRNAAADPAVRKEALRQIQAAAFLGPAFATFQASFTQTLRQIASAEGDPLRASALEHLAGDKDAVARAILMEGLNDPARAAVSEGKALQLLAQDDHATAAVVAKEVLSRQSDELAREEAVRVLASDPSAVDLLADIINDGSQPDRLRLLGASSLRALNPQRFRAEALRVVDDAEASDQLKMHSLSALERMQGAGALDEGLANSLRQLSQETQVGPLHDLATRVLNRD